MIVGVGIGTVDVPEFRASLSDSSIRECFLPDEIAYASSRARPWESFAARLAAKMAGLTALDLGGGADPREVEITRPDSGALGMRFAGAARAAADAMGVAAVHVSVTHTRTCATAVVLLEGHGEERRASAGGSTPGGRTPSVGKNEEGT